MVKRVFCIGNGESRLGFDLEKLKPFVLYNDTQAKLIMKEVFNG